MRPIGKCQPSSHIFKKQAKYISVLIEYARFAYLVHRESPINYYTFLCMQ